MARNRMTIDRQSTKTHVVEQSALFVELFLQYIIILFKSLLTVENKNWEFFLKSISFC